MDQATTQQLLSLNRAFYQTVALPFHRSRRSSWAGWQQVLATILSHLGHQTVLAVLDLGCGNGRWGRYLCETTPELDVTYVGIDENQELLRCAARDLISCTKVLTLIRSNISAFLAQPASILTPARYELIVLFGVWHHLPGAAYRQQLLQQIASRLTPTGILAISCWRFRRSPSLTPRLIEPAAVGIAPTLLEEGDYFLDWRAETEAIRYCHDTAQTELLDQANRAQLALVAQFSADGTTGNLNDYYLFAPANAPARQP